MIFLNEFSIQFKIVHQQINWNKLFFRITVFKTKSWLGSIWDLTLLKYFRLSHNNLEKDNIFDYLLKKVWHIFLLYLTYGIIEH